MAGSPDRLSHMSAPCKPVQIISLSSTIYPHLLVKPPKSYYICEEQMYLPGGLNIQDINEEWLKAEGYTDVTIGRKNGSHRCLALWNGSYQEGILVHQGKKGLICTYLPAISEAEYLRKHRAIQ